MTARRAWVLPGIVLVFIASLVHAAPVPFQPYGEKSSADVVLQLAKITDSPWQAELEAILSGLPSENTLADLSDYEVLIDQYQSDEQALALLIPLYWLTSEVSLYSDQRQHFYSRLDSDSGDFITLLSVDGLLQCHKLSQPFLNDDLHLKEGIRHLYDRSLSQLEQQESTSFLSLWASALLYFYKPGGGLVIADSWLQAQAQSTETPEIITLYRKIFHELAGQTFPLTITTCWPLSCAEAMTTGEMGRRIERAYKVFSSDSFAQAWGYLTAKTGSQNKAAGKSTGTNPKQL